MKTSINSISVARIAELMDLKNFTGNMDLKKFKITKSDINRPALQLAGYYEHFDSNRVEVVGRVEYSYMQKFSSEERRANYEKLMQFEIPCVIFAGISIPARNLWMPRTKTAYLCWEPDVPPPILQRS